MAQRDPMAQLTQVKFNVPMPQHGPMTQRDACAIRFSPLRNDGPRARRRVSFPLWASLPPRAGTFWLDSAACVNFVTATSQNAGKGGVSRVDTLWA